MDIHNLVSMANQIGQFFSAYPDRDDALEGIANHIRKFWEPRMRLQLFEGIDAGKAAESLLPLNCLCNLANRHHMYPATVHADTETLPGLHVVSLHT